MSIDRIKQEKENKFFKKSDIIVYAVLAVLIVVIFLVIFIPKKSGQLTGIEIKYGDISVCTYNFDTDTLTYSPEYVKPEKLSNTQYKLLFYEKEDYKEYNVIIIDLTKREVKCEDADCSLSKDCVHMKINKVGDNIICVPHKLFITALGNSDIPDPVIG